MVKKCTNRSYCFFFSNIHDDLKNKGIEFARDWLPSITLFIVCISQLEEKFFEKWYKSKVGLIEKLVRTCVEYLPKQFPKFIPS